MRKSLLILAASFAIPAAYSDILVTQSIIHTGQVLKVTGTGVAIKVGENEFTVALAALVRVEILKPDAVEKSLTAFRAGKYPEALAGFKSIAERYAGIPLPWAEESLLRLGDTQVALKDYAGARKTFDLVKTYYPSKAAVLEARSARILFEQGQADKALQTMQAVLDPLLKRDYLTEEQEIAVADGLVLMGDCRVAAGKRDEALDDYLKVIALFDVDPDRTIEAKYKAAKLLEQGSKWRRAKQNYDEILKESPNVAFADDVKKRLAELTKIHPE